MTLPPDDRYLSIDIQEHLRQQAIRLRQAGKTFLDIAELFGRASRHRLALVASV
jgi:hypothetical protein